MGIEIESGLESDTKQDRNVVANSPSKADKSAVARASTTLESIDDLQRELGSGDDVCDLPFDLPAGFMLSIVVPVYNEKNTIGQVIRTLHQLPLPIEVIAVDDGSTDGSIAELTSLNKEFPGMRVCIQEKNQGKGAALRRGFEEATGSHVMVQDADLEYNPHEIPSLIEPLARGEVDAVYGSRFMEARYEGSSFVHRFGNKALTQFSNWATGLQLTDMETCYKIVRRDLLNEIELEQDRFGFEVELTAKLAKKKARIVERPVSYAARTWEEGKKIGVKDGLQALYCILRYR